MPYYVRAHIYTLYANKSLLAQQPTANEASPWQWSEVFATARCCNSSHTYVHPKKKYIKCSCNTVAYSTAEAAATSRQFASALPDALLLFATLPLSAWVASLLRWCCRCCWCCSCWWSFCYSIAMFCVWAGGGADVFFWCCCCCRSWWWRCCRSLLLWQAYLLLILVMLVLQREFNVYIHRSSCDSYCCCHFLLLLPCIGFAYWHFKWLQLQQHVRSRQLRLGSPTLSRQCHDNGNERRLRTAFRRSPAPHYRSIHSS